MEAEIGERDREEPVRAPPETDIRKVEDEHRQDNEQRQKNKQEATPRAHVPTR